MGYLRRALDRLRRRSPVGAQRVAPLIDPGLTLAFIVFGLCVPVWLVASVTLVWRHPGTELGLIFLAVFSGVLMLAALAQAGLGLLWVIAGRRFRGRRGLDAENPRRARIALGVAAVAGAGLIVAASLPIAGIGAFLTALPVDTRAEGVPRTFETGIVTSARGLIPFIVELRAATETRAFARPAPAAEPTQPLLTDAFAEIPIDPLSALGILAAVEALLALTRRGPSGLTGHALTLTGLAVLAYLAALPAWVSALARFAVDGEGFVAGSPAERLVVATAPGLGFWIGLALGLALVAAGLTLGAVRRPAPDLAPAPAVA